LADFLDDAGFCAAGDFEDVGAPLDEIRANIAIFRGIRFDDFSKVLAQGTDAALAQGLLMQAESDDVHPGVELLGKKTDRGGVSDLDAAVMSGGVSDSIGHGGFPGSGGCGKGKGKCEMGSGFHRGRKSFLAEVARELGREWEVFRNAAPDVLWKCGWSVLLVVRASRPDLRSRGRDAQSCQFKNF